MAAVPNGNGVLMQYEHLHIILHKPFLLVAVSVSVNAPLLLTRLHSSRMHIARLLTVSPSMHCVRGVFARGRGGWCPAQGASAPGGWTIPACTEADPPVNRITDSCKNITSPQLRLRAVINTRRISVVYLLLSRSCWRRLDVLTGSGSHRSVQ